MSRTPPPESASQQATASGQAQVTQVAGNQYNYITSRLGRAPAPQAVASLQPAPRLVGRAGLVDELERALDPKHPSTGVIVLTGLAGIGKTALALYTAHQTVERGMFPGGVLSVTLRGYDPVGMVSGEQAQAALLRVLGIRDDDLSTRETLSGLYHSELTRRAKEHGPILIIADDVSTIDQLRHLAPAHQGNRLLATSRDALTAPGLHARLIPLDELSDRSAADLIADTLVQIRPSDARPIHEPDALRELAQQCGYLPLALTITAAVLAADPGLPLATLAAELTDTRGRRDTLRLHEGHGHFLGVWAAFELSYRRLTPEQARLFRLLSLNPGPSLSTETAAALVKGPARSTRESLAGLVRAGLVREQPTGSNRWRMHDLVRLYADDLRQRHESESCSLTARARLLSHYATTVEWAAKRVHALPNRPVADRRAALAWLDNERSNLTAAVALAAADDSPIAMSLAEDLAFYLRERRYFHDAIASAKHALAVADRLGDRLRKARAQNNLGLALSELRRFDRAIEAHTCALDIYREIADKRGEARSLNNLGLALREVRRFDEAIEAHTLALDIYREIDGRHGHGEGRVLNSLGFVLREVRRFEESIDAHTRAVAIYKETGDRHGEARAFNGLGFVLREERRFAEAIRAHQHALEIFREVDDSHGEGRAQNSLGLAQRSAHSYGEALNAHKRAIAIYDKAGDRHREGLARNNLGLALREVGRRKEAIEAHTVALTIFREVGDQHSEGRALHNLGLALREANRLDEAIECHSQDLSICRDVGDEHGEARAQNQMGISLRKRWRFEEAIDAHSRAIIIYREIGDRHGEETARRNLFIAQRQTRRRRAVRALWQRTRLQSLTRPRHQQCPACGGNQHPPRPGCSG
ncbi:tetratricopeptide repeat protein [Streptomyces sp. AD2-2]|nr:tetratricopeptide repeat protein [Streptomyces sp. AD2-2]